MSPAQTLASRGDDLHPISSLGRVLVDLQLANGPGENPRVTPEDAFLLSRKEVNMDMVNGISNLRHAAKVALHASGRVGGRGCRLYPRALPFKVTFGPHPFQ